MKKQIEAIHAFYNKIMLSYLKATKNQQTNIPMVYIFRASEFHVPGRYGKSSAKNDTITYWSTMHLLATRVALITHVEYGQTFCHQRGSMQNEDMHSHNKNELNDYLMLLIL